MIGSIANTLGFVQIEEPNFRLLLKIEIAKTLNITKLSYISQM